MEHHGSFALPVVLLLAVLAPYWLLARSVRRRSGWSLWSVASFAAGVLLLAVAMWPPLAGWAHHDLRGHMVQHLLLGMYAPLGLVFGAPGTLLLRSLPAGAARRVVGWLDTAPVRLLIHPATAALLDIGGMAVLYLTPLYALSLDDPAIHVFLHLHFVMSGYLFTWSVAGPDPAPRRPGMRMRLGVLFIATAAHAVLAKIMFGYGYPRGVTAEAAEIQAAAEWMYYGGDLAELLLIAAFFATWFRRRDTLPPLFAAR